MAEGIEPAYLDQVIYAALSHELGYADYVAESMGVPEEARELTRECYYNAGRLSANDLIDSLVDFGFDNLAKIPPNDCN